ncbi:M14 family metallopeptidase [Pseudoalteromonas luteoviolacea]|uniref:M14 metallopeptidase family protein n=1 Tax=Pseudoalteromonas luteoviolacea TaxID=43657 RepID=UPI001F268A4C|nr:M14 metallopeptidase family protein [Pseudoalteromonas luteoviolacea]MCF6438391.1 M14 family metallopeptidase [Pseudoalteromonas luteoviolacea]
MRVFVLLLAFLVFQSQAKPISYYFSPEIEFDQSISKPSDVLGYEVGEWHVRHDQLVNYMHRLAEQSPRLSITTVGYSHEKRPLLLLSATSTEQQRSLESIRQARLAYLKGDTKLHEGPNVIWMGYSVHGNESSGSNAALLVAYYLAAAQGEVIETLLENNIILIDPAMNPDGLARFAHWANSHRGQILSADPAHREHVEAWPSARTNHYWFDLNRDWLLLQHPESRARVEQFHRWKPTVLTDFHEMGTNSSYFFQPGIPSRTHPITPEKNQQLTNKLATYHAKILDNDKQLYFTQESFDDFYIGKGSTYPDVNGTVGILFEQASSRGHVQESINGDLYFHRTIKNQLLTTLSTFQGVNAHRTELMHYQRSFFDSISELASKEKYKGFVVAKGQDIYRFEQFSKLLKRHQVDAYPLTKSLKVGESNYQIGDLYIPLKQPQLRFIQAAFSTQTSFEDNTFYDVSGWTLPYAFDLDFTPVTSSWGLKYTDTPWSFSPNFTHSLRSEGAYAYGIEWHHYLAPKLANLLLKEGIVIRGALKSFSAQTSQGEHTFDAGSVVIPTGLQTVQNWRNTVYTLADSLGIQLFSIRTGLTAQGIDLGSRFMAPLKQPKVLLVGGKGTSQYEVGEVWYHLDRHLSIAPTIIEQARIGQLDLSRYTHLILADGRYDTLNKQAKSAIHAWAKKGGVIWGHKRGAKWLIEQQLLHTETVSTKEMKSLFKSDELPYSERETLAAKQRIAGAIYDTQIDLSHPLAFGFEDNRLPVFKNSTWVMKHHNKPFTNVVKYTPSPLLSGYTDERNRAQIAGSSALIAQRYGQGAVIAMTDNPVFRGYWYGSSRLLSNALFFGGSF